MKDRLKQQLKMNTAKQDEIKSSVAQAAAEYNAARARGKAAQEERALQAQRASARTLQSAVEISQEAQTKVRQTFADSVIGRVAEMGEGEAQKGRLTPEGKPELSLQEQQKEAIDAQLKKLDDLIAEAKKTNKTLAGQETEPLGE